MQHIYGCLARVRTRLFSTSLPRSCLDSSDKPTVLDRRRSTIPPQARIRYIAEMLDLPESYIASKTVFKRPLVVKKIRYLLSIGCSQQQLRSGRFTYLKFSTERIKELTKPTADSDGKPNFENILGDNFETCLNRGKNDMREDVARLLNVQESDLTSVHFKSIKAKTLLPKIKLLLSHGIEASEIFKAPYVLRHSNKNLLKACETLKKQGVEKLKISEISMEIQKKPESLPEITSKLSALLGISTKKLEPFVSNIICSPKAMVPKVEYLIKEGFDCYDITEHMARLSMIQLPSIAEAVSSLQSIKGKDLYIHDVIHYASSNLKGRLNLHEYDLTAKKLAKMLNIPSDKLKMKFFPRRIHQTTLELRDKMELLEKSGFTIDAMRKCPLVLLHDSHILEKYLEELPSVPELQPYEKWMKDQGKLIHALEYIIEKDL
ncbi:unnamed protein product [Owenia fusiformis]|uniref:Uncharacterized protein n=1 Tax=Owenia fusiformis TaxID=6347 RepID=A0A8J1U7P3_OWEFU|nr:unnamed protein product [Owenia fusiformis]